MDGLKHTPDHNKREPWEYVIAITAFIILISMLIK